MVSKTSFSFYLFHLFLSLSLRPLSNDHSQNPPLKFSGVSRASSVPKISSFTGFWIFTFLSVREIYETKFTLCHPETLEKSLWMAAYVFFTVPFSAVLLRLASHQLLSQWNVRSFLRAFLEINVIALFTIPARAIMFQKPHGLLYKLLISWLKGKVWKYWVYSYFIPSENHHFSRHYKLQTNIGNILKIIFLTRFSFE